MTMLKTLCERCVERADTFGWKGKKGDTAAFEYMVGAATALQEANHPEAEHVKNVVALIIAVRGLFEIRKIAATEDGKEAA